ncbi:MAG: hypothetical protein F6K56_00755 [Moorea sp. SIO3G5]|nr:hypothetical protein [Moorena sp. SIO3G5]
MFNNGFNGASAKGSSLMLPLNGNSHYLPINPGHNRTITLKPDEFPLSLGIVGAVIPTRTYMID